MLSRCGWFSDRSACYLASGRPVIAQETGFSRFLPTGEGLLSLPDRGRRRWRRSRSSTATTTGHAARRARWRRSTSTRTRVLEPLAGASRVEPVTQSGAAGVATEELRDALEQRSPDSGDARRIDRLEASPVRLPDQLRARGARRRSSTTARKLRLMFKDLGASALSERARAAKPEFLYDPLREIEAYRSTSGAGGPRHPRLLRCGRRPGARTLLALHRERRRASRSGRSASWRHGRRRPLARRAARPLRRRATCTAPSTCCATTPTSTGSGCAGRSTSPTLGAQQPGRARRTIEWLAERYEPVVERLAALPVTFIHGEFYASNVLVASGQRDRVCPIDWELAAIGPGLHRPGGAARWAGAPSERTALGRSPIAGTRRRRPGGRGAG